MEDVKENLALLKYRKRQFKDDSMIPLMPEEIAIAQVEAKGKGNHGSLKFKGKGTLLVTNQRIVFRDHKKGSLLNLDFPEEFSGCNVIEKDKILIDWQKNGESGKMEFDVEDASDLEAKIRIAQDNARTVQTQIAEATTSSETEDNSVISKELIDLLYDYSADSYNKYNKLKSNLEHLKPYIHKRLGNLIHGTWNGSDPIEDSWLIHRDNAEIAYRTVTKFYPDALKNASREFLDKIATESIRLQYNIDWSKIWTDFDYDPLRVKTVEIDGYLVGMAITHNDSYFVLHPDDYMKDLRNSYGPYGYEENQDQWNELVQAWNEWRYAARRYDVDRSKKTRGKIYEMQRKWFNHEFGNDAQKKYYSWFADGPNRAYLELHSTYLEAMVEKGLQPKEPITPVLAEDELLYPPAN